VSIHTATGSPSAMPVRRGAPVAWGAGPVGLAALAWLLCGSVVSQSAAAAPKLCGDRDQILKRLEQAHDETPQAIGLSGDGGVVEVLVSQDGGWTMLVTYPKRPTCVVAAGAAWEMLQVAGEPA
jgi:hypothetical protein